MDFFNSLTLDLKMLVVAIAGCALLAVCSGNQKAEKRYILVLAVLAAVGVYRFKTVADHEPEPRSAVIRSAPAAKTVPSTHTPLVSTGGR